MRFLGRFVTRFARRSRWLAKRLWLVAAAEIAWITRSHWQQLEPGERRRLIELLRKSRGFPSRLSRRERRETAELLEKFNYAELGGNVAATLLPFRPLARVVEFTLGKAFGGSRGGRRTSRGSA
jgi:hypothetical protein